MSISFCADDSPRGEDMVYTCQCVDWPVEEGVCPECNGTQEIRFQTYQYHTDGFCSGNVSDYIELMTEDNKFEYCGYVDAENVAAVIEKLVDRNDLFNHRLQDILRVFMWAQDNGKGVGWG
jgi:hypothetical protein